MMLAIENYSVAELTMAKHGWCWWLVTDRLSVHRDSIYGSIDKLEDEKGKPLPEGVDFEWYGDKKTEHVKKPLKYVHAEDLANMPLPDEEEDGRVSPYNKAILAFCKSLPSRTWVVLWWC